MSFLREPGDLARTPLAAILLEAWNLRLTGELTVHQAGGDSRLYVRDGMAVGAQTFAGFQPLGQMLLARGLIDIETLGRSLAEMARTGRRQGEVLVEMGAVSRDVVDRVLEEQQAGYVALIAGLEDGGFRFDPEAPVPPWAGQVVLAPLRAVVDALATPQAASLRAAALSQAEGAIALGPGYADLEASFSWSEPERALVDRLHAAAPVARVLGVPQLSRAQAEAALAALLLLGLAEPAGDVVDLGALGTAAPGARPAAGGPPVMAPRTAAPTAAGSPTLSVPATPPPVDPARRSDPEEARARRQRLLARAMQNMGVGPLASGPPRHASAGAPATPRPAAPSTGGADAEIRRALEAALPRAREPDLFARLGLPRGASLEEVKAAYLQLVKQFHPDRYASPGLADLQGALRDVLSSMNEAYATLSDRTRRSEYLARSSSGGRAATEAAAAAARADFQKAEVARRAGDHARARLFLEAAVRSDRRPDFLVALAVEILAGGKAEEREKARRHLDEAMKDPACARAFLVAGQMARVDKDNDRAEKLFRASLRADPRSEEAARELRQIQGLRQSRAEARLDAKK